MTNRRDVQIWIQTHDITFGDVALTWCKGAFLGTILGVVLVRYFL